MKILTSTAVARPVHIFTTDTPATADEQAPISCTSVECLAAWPLATTAGDPEAGNGAGAMLLGITDHEGQQVVTYNG